MGNPYGDDNNDSFDDLSIEDQQIQEDLDIELARQGLDYEILKDVDAGAFIDKDGYK